MYYLTKTMFVIIELEDTWLTYKVYRYTIYPYIVVLHNACSRQIIVYPTQKDTNLGEKCHDNNKTNLRSEANLKKSMLLKISFIKIQY